MKYNTITSQSILAYKAVNYCFLNKVFFLMNLRHYQYIFVYHKLKEYVMFAQLCMWCKQKWCPRQTGLSRITINQEWHMFLALSALFQKKPIHLYIFVFHALCCIHRFNHRSTNSHSANFTIARLDPSTKVLHCPNGQCHHHPVFHPHPPPPQPASSIGSISSGDHLSKP